MGVANDTFVGSEFTWSNIVFSSIYIGLLLRRIPPYTTDKEGRMVCVDRRVQAMFHDAGGEVDFGTFSHLARWT